MRPALEPRLHSGFYGGRMVANGSIAHPRYEPATEADGEPYLSPTRWLQPDPDAVSRGGLTPVVSAATRLRLSMITAAIQRCGCAMSVEGLAGGALSVATWREPSSSSRPRLARKPAREPRIWLNHAES